MSGLKTFNSKKYSNKSAYSLIELSIVLIIVSLLVVVVIGANGLIRNSKLRGIINENQRYNLAVNTFYTRFDSLPGDFGSIILGGGATTGIEDSGDENGYIEYINGASSTGVVEGVSAWQQLSATQMIDDDLAYTTAFDIAITSGGSTLEAVCGVELPSSKIVDSCWVFDYRDSKNTLIITAGVASGVTYVSSTSQTIADASFTGAVAPSDILSIDIKMDDGVSNSGDVRDPYSTNDSATYGCSSSGTYVTGTTTKVCSILFQIGMDII